MMTTKNISKYISEIKKNWFQNNTKQKHSLEN